MYLAGDHIAMTMTSIPILATTNNIIDIDNGDFRAILRISTGKIRIVLGDY